MGIIYRDMERIKEYVKSKKLNELIHPNFTPSHKFSITTTPERLGLKDYQQRKIVFRK